MHSQALRPLSRLLVLVCILLLGVPLVYADTVVEGDLVGATVTTLDLGSVCIGAPATATLWVAIERHGTAGSTNVFEDGSVVTISVLSVTGSGLSSVLVGDQTVTLPANWESRPNNTVSTDTVASTVTLVAGATGPFSGSIVYRATGKSSKDGSTIHRDGTLGVRATVQDCTPADTTPPAFACPADQTVEAAGSTGATAYFTATAVDDVDGTVPVVFAPASGSTFALGTTTVHARATDSAGNHSDCDFAVTVADTTAPAISCPEDIVVEATGPSGAAVTFGATASDLVDGDLTVAFSPASGDTFPFGTTEVTASATDSHGNTATCTFSVTVQDTTPPDVTCPTVIPVEATGPDGATVTFAATATDSGSGVDTVVATPASGSKFAVGDTTVNVVATDKTGNEAICSFTVTVVDTTPPDITVPADMTVEATGPDGAVVTFSASAVDLVDGPVAITSVPPSGSAFALGTTQVTVSAVDAHGNAASEIFNVTVVDTTPPAITVPADMTVEATGPDGAVVDFTVMATDLVDGDVNPVVVPTSGSTFALGETVVNVTATDEAGNEAEASFTVTVVDTTPPGFDCPGDITVSATGNSQAVVTFLVTAYDLVDGDVDVTLDHASGSSFPVGSTKVTATAIDSHGNAGTCTFYVTVKYAFNGFFRPVDNLPVYNVVKAGSAVPVKFSLGGYQGMLVLAPGFPGSMVIPQDPTAQVDLVEITLTAGQSSLSYDATTDQYVYVWKTDKAWAGTCRQLVVLLRDGTVVRANFKFTR